MITNEKHGQKFNKTNIDLIIRWLVPKNKALKAASRIILQAEKKLAMLNALPPDLAQSYLNKVQLKRLCKKMIYGALRSDKFEYTKNKLLLMCTEYGCDVPENFGMQQSLGSSAPIDSLSVNPDRIDIKQNEGEVVVVAVEEEEVR